MSAPASKAALDKLEKIVEENDKADDWLFASGPTEIIPTRVQGDLTSSDVVQITGPIRLPKKPKR